MGNKPENTGTHESDIVRNASSRRWLLHLLTAFRNLHVSQTARLLFRQPRKAFEKRHAYVVRENNALVTPSCDTERESAERASGETLFFLLNSLSERTSLDRVQMAQRHWFIELARLVSKQTPLTVLVVRNIYTGCKLGFEEQFY